ncbi:glycoside hydrolase family 16 protein [Infundibulicybe gibba]|nr:glycoside hydrolase family 16 protein [Infundibulicybe gibba]
MLFFFHIALIISLIRAAHISPPRVSDTCRPIHTTFPPSSIPDNPHDQADFIAISPYGSYQAGGNGLELYLHRPNGPIKTMNGTNDKLGAGATMNSTFTLLRVPQYAIITFEILAPTIPGVVTAAILMGAEERDEIDIEILGGDPSHWQTNLFAPPSTNSRSMYGVFSSRQGFHEPGQNIAELHKYTIDWNQDRITWAVDGEVKQTITKEQTRRNGDLHYPSHPSHIQLGIWDASNPIGTAQWARGPINWKTTPQQVIAIIKSVTVECPDP